jgi:hypothetical protein
MIELAFELVGAANLVAALIYFAIDENDIMHWLFYLLVSAIMYINAIRYDKGNE